MTCLIDTNVIVDVITNDPTWADWSEQQLEIAARRGSLVVNDIVYAELCGRFASYQEADATPATLNLRLATLTKPALFAAGQAHRRYRARGGPRESILPDLLIGAHAAVEGWTLISRDPRRYRTDFPRLQVVSP